MCAEVVGAVVARHVQWQSDRCGVGPVFIRLDGVESLLTICNIDEVVKRSKRNNVLELVCNKVNLFRMLTSFWDRFEIDRCVRQSG